MLAQAEGEEGLMWRKGSALPKHKIKREKREKDSTRKVNVIIFRARRNKVK